MTSRDVALELAKAAEHLQRAALGAINLDPRYGEDALAWSREATELLDWSLEFRARHEMVG